MASRPETRRLFFALWPGPETRARLERAAACVPRKLGKPVAVEKLHLTLAFLGSVDAETQACAEDVASAVRRPAFELVLDDIGHFRRSQVVWLGSGRVPEALAGLVADLAAGLEACGIAPERRPYRPHLTLARKVRRFPGCELSQPVTWPVHEFCLVWSRTLPEGAVYEVLRTWSLQAP